MITSNETRNMSNGRWENPTLARSHYLSNAKVGIFLHSYHHSYFVVSLLFVAGTYFIFTLILFNLYC